MMMRIKLWAAAFLAAIAAALGIYAKGRADAQAKAAVKDMQQELKIHDRLNKAETGADLDDAGRAAWLREFADRNRD